MSDQKDGLRMAEAQPCPHTRLRREHPPTCADCNEVVTASPQSADERTKCSSCEGTIRAGQKRVAQGALVFCGSVCLREHEEGVALDEAHAFLESIGAPADIGSSGALAQLLAGARASASPQPCRICGHENGTHGRLCPERKGSPAPVSSNASHEGAIWAVWDDGVGGIVDAFADEGSARTYAADHTATHGRKTQVTGPYVLAPCTGSALRALAARAVAHCPRDLAEALCREMKIPMPEGFVDAPSALDAWASPCAPPDFGGNTAPSDAVSGSDRGTVGPHTSPRAEAPKSPGPIPRTSEAQPGQLEPCFPCAGKGTICGSECVACRGDGQRFVPTPRSGEAPAAHVHAAECPCPRCSNDRIVAERRLAEQPRREREQTSEGASTPSGERAPHEPDHSLADRGSVESASFGTSHNACVADSEWGCEARKKLGIARGVLHEIADGEAGDHGSFDWQEFYASIRATAQEAFEATGQPQPCAPASPSSCPAWALVAWLMDRREQYKPSSGTYSAFDELIAAIADGEHVEAWKHGETDDLRGAAENCIAKRPASPFTRAADVCPACGGEPTGHCTVMQRSH